MGFTGSGHSQFECGEYPGILRGILSVPQNIVMALNNVMRFVSVQLIWVTRILQCHALKKNSNVKDKIR